MLGPGPPRRPGPLRLQRRPADHAGDGALGLTAGEAGDIGSYTTFGMLVGALCAGTVTDWIGRKKVLLADVTLFSLASALSAAARTRTSSAPRGHWPGWGSAGCCPSPSRTPWSTRRPGGAICWWAW
ncbi:MFS transporter [Streptomyces sp. M19]